MTLFRNRVFAAVMEVMIEKRSYWTWVNTKSNESPHKRQKRMHREEGHVKMEAEVGVMLPKAKSIMIHQKLQEARKYTLLELSGGYSTARTLTANL